MSETPVQEADVPKETRPVEDAPSADEPIVDFMAEAPPARPFSEAETKP